MLDEMHHSETEEETIRLFEDNDDFRERLGILEEIAPDYAAYNHNCIRTAFRRAISRRPLNGAPLPPIDLPPMPSSSRQTKIVEYFRWSRNFPDLPMEVVLEIASHMAPSSLLNLSRTSKLFRKTLMNKASRWVWQGALLTVPGLPPCPDDLNEALYTALVFDHHCFGCGSPNTFSVDYALRLRLCEQCWKENVINGGEVLDGVSPGVYPFVFMLLPSANTFNFTSFKDIRRSLTRVNPQTHITQDWYYKPELQALLDFFWPNLLTVGDLTTLRTAFLDRVEQVVRKQTHAVELYAWERVIGAEGHVVPNVTLGRATEDCHYLDFGFSMGWHMNPRWDDILDDDDDDDNYIPVPSPEAIAQGAVLNTNPPKSKAQLAKEHRSRADREAVAYRLRLEDRYHELAQCYEDLVNDAEDVDEDMMPNAYDGARLFDALATRNDARAGIHQGSVGDLEETVLMRARTYTRDVCTALAALLPHDSGRQKDPLARPTALFVCGVPGCRGDYGLEWPVINFHWHYLHRDKSVWIPALGGQQHRRIRAVVWAEGAKVANRMLDAAGLARDTRIHRLNKLCMKGRLGCACGDPCLSEGSLSWSSLVHHVYGHLKMDECYRPCNDIPWINDHHDLTSCIKLLPEGANTKAAFACTSADPGVTARVKSFRATRPEVTWLVCLLCEAVLDRKKAAALSVRLIRLQTADEIVHHMQAKHGIPFDEKNISFQQPPPDSEKVQVDLRSFCRDEQF